MCVVFSVHLVGPMVYLVQAAPCWPASAPPRLHSSWRQEVHSSGALLLFNLLDLAICVAWSVMMAEVDAAPSAAQATLQHCSQKTLISLLGYQDSGIAVLQSPTGPLRALTIKTLPFVQ